MVYHGVECLDCILPKQTMMMTFGHVVQQENFSLRVLDAYFWKFTHVVAHYVLF